MLFRLCVALLQVPVCAAASCSLVPKACATAAPAPSQAACVVRVGDKAVLVQDQWSRRYALPGGPHAAGQSLADAAAAQTATQTGLVVHAESRLGDMGDTAVFDCRLVRPMALLPKDVVVMPPQARRTTVEARLWRVSDVPARRLRYMSQARAIPLFATLATPADSAFVQAAPIDAARPMFVRELVVTRSIQAFVPTGLDIFVTALSQLGTELALCMLVSLIACMRGWRAGVEFALYMMAVCLVNCLCKQLCGLPRPFYLDPALQRQHASGFGFPSGHTLCAASMALWLGHKAFVKRHNLHVILALAALACGFSRLYLGVHFLHDVIGAWAESVLLFVLYAAMLRRMDKAALPLGAWARGLTLISGIALCVQPEPDSIVFMGIALGLVVGAACCRLPAMPMARWPGFAMALCLVASFTGVHALAVRARPIEASLAACVTLTVVSAVAYGLVVPVVVSLGTWVMARLGVTWHAQAPLPLV